MKTRIFSLLVLAALSSSAFAGNSAPTDKIENAPNIDITFMPQVGNDPEIDSRLGISNDRDVTPSLALMPQVGNDPDVDPSSIDVETSPSLLSLLVSWLVA
jgi:hypothetical protein